MPVTNLILLSSWPGTQSSRYIKIAIFLSIIIHGWVLFYVEIHPSAISTVPKQTIQVSLQSSLIQPTLKQSPPNPKPDKLKPPRRIITTPSIIPDTPVIQQPVEVPPVTTPPSVTPPVVVSQISTPSEPKIETVSNLTRLPGPLRKIEPNYPAFERRAGIQGYVLAEVILDATGKVTEVNILKSGGKAFDSAVIETLKKSEFTPGYIGNNAVPVRISIPFRFNLK